MAAVGHCHHLHNVAVSTRMWHSLVQAVAHNGRGGCCINIVIGVICLGCRHLHKMAVSTHVDKHIDDDMAVALGVLCSTGDWGTSWGKQGGAEECGGRHWRLWSWWGCSIECTTHSDECIHTTLHNGICCAVDSVGASFMGW